MFANDTNLLFNNVSCAELYKNANEEWHQVDYWLTETPKKTKVK